MLENKHGNYHLQTGRDSRMFRCYNETQLHKKTLEQQVDQVAKVDLELF